MDHESFDYIRKCGRWSYAQHTHDGNKGTLAFWGKGAPTRAEIGVGVTLENGLVYFAPNPLPTQKELAKKSPYPAVDVMTHCGRQLSIPLAVGAPRLVSFTGYELGDFIDEFPIVAARIEAALLNANDDEEHVAVIDSDILDLVFLAISQTYSVTPELLNDLKWITSLDIVPIISAVMGSDPLASGGAGDTSNLLPQESKEMDSSRPESGAA